VASSCGKGHLSGLVSLYNQRENRFSRLTVSQAMRDVSGRVFELNGRVRGR
jgi:hypothetical protein